MIVCLCKGVSDRTVRALAEQGVATTPEEVGRACAAGTDCGACRETICRILYVERPLLRPEPLLQSSMSPAP